jgi:hypothetical protein
MQSHKDVICSCKVNKQHRYGFLVTVMTAFNTFAINMAFGTKEFHFESISIESRKISLLSDMIDKGQDLVGVRMQDSPESLGFS